MAIYERVSTKMNHIWAEIYGIQKLTFLNLLLKISWKINNTLRLCIDHPASTLATVLLDGSEVGL